MKAENLNICFPEGKQTAEVVIREVNQVVEQKLPVKEPLPVNIVGNITAPYTFIEKRWEMTEDTDVPVYQVDHGRTHLIIDRDNLSITLVMNETDERQKMTVKGRLQLSRKFCDFGINGDKQWDPIELGNFFRINRTYFESREENMRLVSLFKNFKAKVTTDIEREQKDNGSVTDSYRKVVDSNLPDAFNVCMSIYKGAEKETFQVEVIAEVKGKDVFLKLISPDAQAIVEDVRDIIIDGQIALFKENMPSVPVIEV